MADAPDYSSGKSAGRVDDSSAAGRDDDQEFVLGRESVSAALDGAVTAPVDVGDVEFPSEMARTRSLPVAGAGHGPPAATDVEFHADSRPTFKAFGAPGSTAVMPAPSASLLRAAKPSALHRGARGSTAPANTAAATTQQLDKAAVPDTPPTLRPAPFFLMPNHCDVPACIAGELMQDIADVLRTANVSFTTKPSTCKFKCVLHAPSGRASFRVKLYSRSKTPSFAVEVHRLSGSAVLCNAVYRMIMQHLAKTRTVVKPNGSEVAASAKPVSLSTAKFAPRAVPRDLLSTLPSPSADDLRPLCETLASEYDEVVQDGARTAAALCAGPAANAVSTSTAVVKALVGVLDHANRSPEARSPAAIALDTISRTPAGTRALVDAAALPALLQHIMLSESATPEEASKTWHLRRSCVRAVANLCCSTDADVVKAVRGNADVLKVLDWVPSHDADMAPVATRALQSLRC